MPRTIARRSRFGKGATGVGSEHSRGLRRITASAKIKSRMQAIMVVHSPAITSGLSASSCRSMVLVGSLSVDTSGGSAVSRDMTAREGEDLGIRWLVLNVVGLRKRYCFILVLVARTADRQRPVRRLSPPTISLPKIGRPGALKGAVEGA